ncbi:AAA family ATPase [Planctomycetota bacterium]
MARSKPSVSDAEPFPVRRIASVDPRPKEARWLVEPLWTAESVGLIASSPKQGKTWLAAELALAVATGGLALGRFPARQSGPVLFFGAEDAPPRPASPIRRVGSG